MYMYIMESILRQMIFLMESIIPMILQYFD